jgi:hypothetical protein
MDSAQVANGAQETHLSYERWYVHGANTSGWWKVAATEKQEQNRSLVVLLATRWRWATHGQPDTTEAQDATDLD